METTQRTSQEASNKIITIPNILSFFRLCLIPFLVWHYCVKKDYTGAAIILLVSGFTDILDGFIARRFHMVSNVGKALDPVADKLTQIAMLICLLTNFPLMWIPLILLVAKEIFAAVTGMLVVKKTGKVYGAEWHGKLNTVMIYGMIVLHLVWPDIPTGISIGLIVLSVLVMVDSSLLYCRRNYRILKEKPET